jgi:hypothetical protein
MWLLFALACGSPSGDTDGDAPIDTDSPADTDTGGDTDTGEVPAEDPYADYVVSFAPGEGSGFGQDDFPDVVFGPPRGGTSGNASLHVLSLGREGEIVLGFDDVGLIDGEGVDLIVFENPFSGWVETGVVAVSEDGETWAEWPCDPLADGYPGCAGVDAVYAGPDANDPTDPSVAGGDQYDLAELGIAEARFVRIRDSGANSYDGISGGFDLDAVAVVNGQPL